MKAYKAVSRHESGHYASAIKHLNSEGKSHQFSLIYKVGHKTVPKVGKIFVFEKEVNAVRFITSHFFLDLVVFECECGELKPQKHLGLWNYIEKFWNTGAPCLEMSAPTGSFVTDYVILKKELTASEN